MIAAMIIAPRNSRTATAVLAAAARPFRDRSFSCSWFWLTNAGRLVAAELHTASIFLPTIGHSATPGPGGGICNVPSWAAAATSCTWVANEFPSMTVGTPSSRSPTTVSTVAARPRRPPMCSASLAFKGSSATARIRPQIMRLANGANTRAHMTARKTIRPTRIRVSKRSLDRTFRSIASFVDMADYSFAVSSSSSQAAIELNDGFFGDEHHDDDDDQDHDSVEGPAEIDVVAERKRKRLENDELGTEQDDPRGEETHELRKAARLGFEIGRDAVLERNRRLQQHLQHHGGEQGDRERVDDDVLGVLDEQVQHREIDQDPGEVPEEQSLLVGRPLRRGWQQEALFFSCHGLFPKVGGGSIPRQWALAGNRESYSVGTARSTKSRAGAWRSRTAASIEEDRLDFLQPGRTPMALRTARDALSRFFYQRCFWLFVMLLALIAVAPFLPATTQGRHRLQLDQCLRPDCDRRGRRPHALVVRHRAAARCTCARVPVAGT